MNRLIFEQVKKIIPKISETELIALRSGGFHLDREIFGGTVDRNKLVNDKPIPLSVSDKEFLAKTNLILKEIGQNNLYPSKEFPKILDNLGKNGYFSLIIDPKYGGHKLSFSAQTKLLTKISSYNPSLGVVVMVPNSLGPSELLQHYGTQEQKDKYLNRLANGSLVPCFGLTGPNNGSDATGEIDTGYIIRDEKGDKKIVIELNKRYITLAPVSNLIAIAFDCRDPDNLCSGRKGITVVLVEKGHEGLEQLTYHNPNNAGFPNGTLKGKIIVDPKYVIGGEENIGKGWKMLMECLAVGRGISLPSSANGSTKLITYGIFHYLKHRNQFKISIGRMEGIQEKYVKMVYQTLVIQASVSYISHILDKKITPSVLTAIMKQQTTERAREVIQLGMDIYAGSGICIGENNFFTKFYNSCPIGITVEGSNTLTRSLIIFGQGINKSHPHIYNLFQSIQEDDVKRFNIHFKEMFIDTIQIYFQSIFHFGHDSRLDKLTMKFANLSNFVALLGGGIKSKQMISGNMADILSNIFLSYAVIWYFHHHYDRQENARIMMNFLVDNLCQEAEIKLNTLIKNYPNKLLSTVLIPTRTKLKETDFRKMKEVFEIIQNDPQFIHDIKKDLFYEDTVIERLEKLSMINKKQNPKDYNELYQKIIQVGEFEI